MADTSVISCSREATLSAFSISRPAVLSPRPYSSRKSSAAQFHLMHYKDHAHCDGLAQYEKFPNIQNLEISQSDGIQRSSNKIKLKSDKESAFPNFRLLQRLAASAKARISSDTASEGSPAMKEVETKEIIKTQNTHQTSQANTSDSTELNWHDVLNASVSSDLKIPLPPPEHVKDGNSKVKRSKSRRQHRKLKTKKQGKHTPPENGHVPSFHLLQPTSSKIIPTFSQKFRKQRDRQTRRKVTTKVGKTNSFSNSLSNGYYFSLRAYPEVLEISQDGTSATDINDLNCTDEKTRNKNIVKEAKLHAIYNSSQDLNSLTSDGLSKVKLKKVFQSEKQSGSISQCGRLFPCAPPTSPTPQMLEKYEFVPSLADLRSQQTVKQRLTVLEKEDKKKQQASEQDKKRKENQLLQERCKAERVRHRQEVYALNRIMTKLEKDHYKSFKEKKGAR